MGRSLGTIGIDVHGRRIALPRHFLDSDLRTSDGRVLVGTSKLEFDPAVSRDGTRVAYTVENDSRFEIWVADSNGNDPRYVALGRHPRFSPSGNEIVYSRIDVDGNKDIWKADVRTGLPERLTDAPEIDDVPDWSPDGRSIVFSSEWNGRMSLWVIPSSGGQRLRLNDGGFAPRHSPDGTRIAYWSHDTLWTARPDGSEPEPAGQRLDPAFAVWSPSGVLWTDQGQIFPGNLLEVPWLIWPPFDSLGNGIWVVAALDVEKTELWAIDLLFEE
jgi:Tol biopolymer transport system component